MGKKVTRNEKTAATENHRNLHRTITGVVPQKPGVSERIKEFDPLLTHS